MDKRLFANAIVTELLRVSCISRLPLIHMNGLKDFGLKRLRLVHLDFMEILIKLERAVVYVDIWYFLIWK